MKALGQGTSAVGTAFGSCIAVVASAFVACTPSVAGGTNDSIVVASKEASFEDRSILGTLVAGIGDQVGTWDKVGNPDSTVGEACPRGLVQSWDFLLIASVDFARRQIVLQIQLMCLFQ